MKALMLALKTKQILPLEFVIVDGTEKRKNRPKDKEMQNTATDGSMRKGLFLKTLSEKLELLEYLRER
jgi:hypothetical protein